MNNQIIETNDRFIIVFNDMEAGRCSYNVPKEAVDISVIRKRLFAGETWKVRELLDPKAKIEKATKYCDVEIVNNDIVYKGKSLGDSAKKFLVDYVSNEGNTRSVRAFLKKCLENPNQEIATEIWGFIGKNKMPITSSGNFLALKIVDRNFKSLYSCPVNGKMDNSIGNTVTIDRDKIDANRNTVCSFGLHACSKDYLEDYGSDRKGDDIVVIVEINPKDVVCFPRDYDLAKMRVCEYKVVGISEHRLDNPEVFKDKVIDTSIKFSAPTKTSKGWVVKEYENLKHMKTHTFKTREQARKFKKGRA